MAREKYINECCKICGEEFENVEDIYVDEDCDDYVCLECARIHRLHVNEIGFYSESKI